MKAISIYRLSHFLYLHHIPFLPKLLQYTIYLLYNCWIPYNCKIGKGTKLGYGGIAVVIHKDAVIGENCIIGTCVTIGGNKANSGLPIIGDSCYIASGAKVFGEIVIGNESFIGANAVVTKSAPKRSLIAGIPAKVVKENIDINDYSVHIKKKEKVKDED